MRDVQQIVSAAGWHFVTRAAARNLIVFPLAVWALSDDARVYGLAGDVPLGGSEPPFNVSGDTARLILPPPMCGQYKHLSTMTAAERAAIATPENAP